jgi:hypothetical protein
VNRGWHQIDWKLTPSIASQVWELVRRFDQPQRYKPFVRNCVVRGDQLEVGSLRDVNVNPGLPATTSTERLEQLDDDLHILGVKFVGGDHRLQVRAAAARLLRPCKHALLHAPSLLVSVLQSFFCWVCLLCYHFSFFKKNKLLSCFHFTAVLIAGCYA